MKPLVLLLCLLFAGCASTPTPTTDSIPAYRPTKPVTYPVPY